MSVDIDPLESPPPPEIALANAPLVRVIAQVRFPEVLAIEQRAFVAPFQEMIRNAYPVLREEQTQGVLLGPAGIAPVRPQTAWRFIDESGKWRVSLTSEFIALETTSYSSRSDFFTRLQLVLEAFNRQVQPKIVDRLGVRYIDRVSGSTTNDIVSLVRKEMLGIIGSAADSHTIHAITEAMLEASEGRLMARWGLLAPNSTIDPAAIEPVDQRSWILDLDMFSSQPYPFSVDRVICDARRYAERIYTVFRWTVTEEFLRRYGGAFP